MVTDIYGVGDIMWILGHIFMDILRYIIASK